MPYSSLIVLLPQPWGSVRKKITDQYLVFILHPFSAPKGSTEYKGVAFSHPVAVIEYYDQSHLREKGLILVQSTVHPCGEINTQEPEAATHIMSLTGRESNDLLACFQVTLSTVQDHRSGSTKILMHCGQSTHLCHCNQDNPPAAAQRTGSQEIPDLPR